MSDSDYIILLAWPEGMVVAAGAWYDFLLAKNGQYRVGHSALILVNSETKKFHYMDFGRYHTPDGYGRVRDSETDPDVSISEKAEIENGEILNIEKILIETANKKANHGEGILYSSVIGGVDFNKAYNHAKYMQNKGAMSYGPFIRRGSNCSRFVSKIARKSGVSILKRFRLKIQANFTPSPKRNITIANPNFYRIDGDTCKKINRTKLKAYFVDIEKENAQN